ncbi:glycoside hydrolase domain-containing protein [Streptomyces sp. NPDC002088]|uniref:glycoside hydrolase domain-containing protein n=1 Tax=Streptomyces sp. NPDC002088 TaxID=3154665 RepID=UPI003333118C
MTAPARVPSGDPVRAAPPDPTAPQAGQWTQVGPSVVVRGSATGRPRVTGRFRALAVSPDGLRIYAGSALGGLWYSADQGDHWIALDLYASVRDADGRPRYADALTVGAIAVQWDTPATDVVYVGTGERPPIGPGAQTGTVQGVGVRVATGPAAAVAATGAAAADPWRLETIEDAGVAVRSLALDPTTPGVVWAATSRGLYRRRAGGGRWEARDTGLGDGEVCDVVASGGALYAATPDGRLARTTDGTNWQQIALPQAASTPMTRIRLAAGPPAVVWVLGDGPRLWRVDGAAAEIVTGLPPRMLGGDVLDEDPYGMALAAHPVTADLIVVGGQAEGGQAALYKGAITRVGGGLTFVSPIEWIGDRIPVGVHALAWLSSVPHLWVAGDSGLFRSVTDGAGGSFTARNTGLAAARVTALGPAASGDLLLATAPGTGVLRPLDRETWTVALPGARGGVAADPDGGARMYAQVGNGRWQRSTDGGRTWKELPYLTRAAAGATAARQRAWQDAHRQETDAAAATGRLALFLDDDSPRGTQLALGTDRIWYADAAALRAAENTALSGWVTLPTAADPFDPARQAAPDRLLDRLDGAVLAAYWGTADRLYALTRTSVYLFDRDPTTGTWAPQADHLYDQAAVHRNWKGKVPSGQIPDGLPLQTLAVHDAGTGKGTLYVGTAGPGNERHLWWFDGSGRWLPAGFERDTPVHTIAVDPDHPETVYLGTDAGVWRGTGDFTGSDPAWQWDHFSTGLPEAPCVDLALRNGLLRAALIGRGVWEIPLDGRAQGPQVYLRAHAHDDRLTGTPSGGPADPLTAAGGQARLDASPDIRIWRTPAAPPPQPMATVANPVALPVGPGSATHDIWLLESALAAAGAELDPDGIWDPAIAPALAARVAALAPALPANATAQHVWDRVAAGNAMPYDLDPPDHADLAAYLRDEPDRWPKGAPASCATGDGLARVQVVVHSRHWNPIAAARVSVALLRTRWPASRDLTGAAPLPAGWAAALLADRALAPAARGAWLAGSSWEYADRANQFRQAPATIEPSCPQVAVFDVSLAGPHWDRPGWLLLAVVLADDDPIATQETDVARLVRTDHRVAARSVRKARVPERPMIRYPGMDISRYPRRQVMDTAWTDSNIMWTGLYLDSPTFAQGTEQVVAPNVPQGEVLGQISNGHNRAGNAPAPGAPDAWMSAWAQITPHFGVLVIYWGQQDPANGHHNNNTGLWDAQGPFDLRNIMGVTNAENAVAQAQAAGVPVGSVIYLDYERSAPVVADGITYTRAWFHRLAELGYRPGLYAPRTVSPTLRQECPGLLVWNVRLQPNPPGNPPPPLPNAWQVIRNQLVLESDQAVGHPADPDPLIRQWAFDTQLLFPLLNNPVVGFPVQPFRPFRPDLDISVVADPSFPERRNQPGEIRGGRVAVTPSNPAMAAIHAIRRGRPVRVTWSAGQADVRDPDLVPAALPYQWNPFSQPAAVRTAAGADLLIALGFAAAEAEHVWRVQVLRRAPGGSTWQHRTLAQAGFSIDPLPGVASSTRSDASVEVFVVDDTTGRLAGARRDRDRHTWSALTPLTTQTGASATTEVRRTNRHTAVSRGAGLLDLFWVGGDGLVRTTASLQPGQWGIPRQIGAPTVRAHPFTNPAVVSRDANHLDVLFIGRADGTQPWLLQLISWTSNADWSAATQAVGGAATALEPMGAIAACSRTPTVIDAFAVAATGELLRTSFDQGTGVWTALTAIGGQPVVANLPLRVASVDGACCQGANDIEVIVSDRRGNVWATHWNTGLAAYTRLVPIAGLALV